MIPVNEKPKLMLAHNDFSGLGGTSWQDDLWGDRTPWGHFDLSWGHKKPLGNHGLL